MTLRFWCFTLLALLLCPFASHSEPVGNRITNLYDAFGKDIPGLTQDFGFSALIEWEGKKILFDAGPDAEIQKQNAKTLGVDLSDVDLAVASHSHFDHINGFDYLLTVNPDVKIYFPSDPFFEAPFVFDVTGTDSAASNALSVDQRYFRGGNTRFTFEQSGRFCEIEHRIRFGEQRDLARPESRDNTISVSRIFQSVPESYRFRRGDYERRDQHHRPSRTLTHFRD
ncbi:MAG: hypothetical protein CME26_11140 [Gemmatimonadetes bacterium]|nr:hypothetical protein [Gemmatimonadota bacterium]